MGQLLLPHVSYRLVIYRLLKSDVHTQPEVPRLILVVIIISEGNFIGRARDILIDAIVI